MVLRNVTFEIEVYKLQDETAGLLNTILFHAKQNFFSMVMLGLIF